MRLRAVTIVSGAVLALVVAGRARGQRIDPTRGKTLVVGVPGGPSPLDRVDAARSGASRAPLPTGTLHVAWRRNLGLPVEAAPLVDARGDVTILTARGDLVVLAADGEERSDTVIGAAAAGPAALLSDGTAAFLTTTGDVVGVRLGTSRFRTHVGGGRSSVSPLALADGGVVVATQGELVALDAEGNVRARAAVDPEDAPSDALVSDGQAIYAVTTSGTVLGWVPGAGREVAHVGTFRGALDGGMALVRGAGRGGASVLVGVTGTELVALDTSSSAATTLAAGATSGAIALIGPPAVHERTVSILGLTASRTIALAFTLGAGSANAGADGGMGMGMGMDGGVVDSDPATALVGAEAFHQAVGPTILLALPDGGVNMSSLPPHLGPVVDPRGDIAFTLPSGELGVAAPSGTVDVLGAVCTKSGAPSALASLGIRGGPTYAGLAPAGPSALIVACGTGVIARIDSDFAPSP